MPRVYPLFMDPPCENQSMEAQVLAQKRRKSNGTALDLQTDDYDWVGTFDEEFAGDFDSAPLVENDFVHMAQLDPSKTKRLADILDKATLLHKAHKKSLHSHSLGVNNIPSNSPSKLLIPPAESLPPQSPELAKPVWAREEGAVSRTHGRTPEESLDNVEDEYDRRKHIQPKHTDGSRPRSRGRKAAANRQRVWERPSTGQETITHQRAERCHQKIHLLLQLLTCTDALPPLLATRHKCSNF
eukprot:g20291.t1